MTIVEVFLILVGILLIICSFFITEKLSGKDLKKIAELSDKEIGIVMERELAEAKAKISDIVDDSVDLSLNKINRDLNKETDDKIMAIGEYSDTVMDSLNKTHNEVTFLYSMLNDKHEELTKAAADVSQILTRIENVTGYEEPIGVPVHEEPLARKEDADILPLASGNAEEAFGGQQTSPQASAAPVTSASAPENLTSNGTSDAPNHNEEIIRLYREGMEPVEIAKRLGLGYGEVSLVIELYDI